MGGIALIVYTESEEQTEEQNSDERIHEGVNLLAVCVAAGILMFHVFAASQRTSNARTCKLARIFYFVFEFLESGIFYNNFFFRFCSCCAGGIRRAEPMDPADCQSSRCKLPRTAVREFWRFTKNDHPIPREGASFSTKVTGSIFQFSWSV